MGEEDVLNVIRNDPRMMRVIETAAELQLPDWTIGGGFVRNAIWDHLHGYPQGTNITDVDLVYFDPNDLDEATEKEYDRLLTAKLLEEWSTKNQARMHIKNNEDPYTSTADSMLHWAETATCVGVSLKEGELRLMAPVGIDDLVTLRVRLNPYFKRGREVMEERMAKRQWLLKWPKLVVIE